jgi:hypothetical protein
MCQASLEMSPVAGEIAIHQAQARMNGGGSYCFKRDLRVGPSSSITILNFMLVNLAQLQKCYTFFHADVPLIRVRSLKTLTSVVECFDEHRGVRRRVAHMGLQISLGPAGARTPA